MITCTANFIKGHFLATNGFYTDKNCWLDKSMKSKNQEQGSADFGQPQARNEVTDQPINRNTVTQKSPVLVPLRLSSLAKLYS